MSMVELEPVVEEETISARDYHHAGDLETKGLVEIMPDLGRGDAERLYQLIARHKSFTGSRAPPSRDPRRTGDEYLPKFRR